MRRWFDIAVRVIAVISVMVWPVLFFRTPHVSRDAAQSAGDSSVPVGPAILGASTSSLDAERQTVTDLAERFVERLGTYTNQSTPSDMDVLKSNATAHMQGQFADFFKARDTGLQKSGAEFMAVTTTALSAEISKRNVDWMQVVVTTKRVSVSDQTSKQAVEYQAIIVECAKVGEHWKVDYLNLTP